MNTCMVGIDFHQTLLRRFVATHNAHGSRGSSMALSLFTSRLPKEEVEVLLPQHLLHSVQEPCGLFLEGNLGVFLLREALFLTW